MLISKTVKIKWNPKIKKYYVDLGYKYTKMNEEFEVKVEDLTKGSYAMVEVQCDYCDKIYSIPWYSYYKSHNKFIKKDCCDSPECTGRKAQETIQQKYNVNNFREIESVNEKIKNTNLERYGCENPFGNKEIQQKIKQHYIDNYGVEYNTQIPENKEKYRNTCLEKYGVENYSQTEEFRNMFRGEKSPVWKGDHVLHERTERSLPEYRDWRKSVFIRDKYTCQCCKAKNGHGKYIRLEAHHINNWKDYPELRLNVDNGITLCANCHIMFHSIYGKKMNNEFQLNQFLDNYFNKDEKIC